MRLTEAHKVTPGGDPGRKAADTVNQHADLLNYGQFQPRTMAELANEDPTIQAGRSFFVSNESGGPCIVVSDGANWRRLTLGATATP